MVRILLLMSLRAFNTEETPIMNGKCLRTWRDSGGR